MKKDLRSAFVLIFLILLFLLLFFFYTMIQTIEEGGNEVSIKTQEEKETENSPEAEQNPIKKILEKYGSKYIKAEGPSIYVEFAKDLYNKNGESNKNYFVKIIDEIVPYFKEQSFYLIDNSQEIYIHVRYNFETKDHTIIINEMENFYENSNGKNYIAVDESEIVKRSGFMIMDPYLFTLSLNSYYFDSISEKIGEGTDLGNGYTSFLNGTIKLRTVPTGGVRNIVYTSDYEGGITTEINAGMKLKEIKEIEPENAFGSISDDYLGYREDNFYVFFYDNELSFYPYSYKKNTKFETLLEEYLENRDLNLFVKNLKSGWMAYDHLEYNPETNSADILYSTRGVHIKIENNEPKGITFYSNYCFTDYTKKLVKQGIVDFKPGVDLVHETELERRKNN